MEVGSAVLNIGRRDTSCYMDGLILVDYHIVHLGASKFDQGSSAAIAQSEPISSVSRHYAPLLCLRSVKTLITIS